MEGDLPDLIWSQRAQGIKQPKTAQIPSAIKHVYINYTYRTYIMGMHIFIKVDVHARDVVDKLKKEGVNSAEEFSWTSQMR